MKKTIRLTENDLISLVKKVLNEDNEDKLRVLNRMNGDLEEYRTINSHIKTNMDELYSGIKSERTNRIEYDKEQLFKLLKRAEEKINELKRNITRL